MAVRVVVVKRFYLALVPIPLRAVRPRRCFVPLSPFLPVPLFLANKCASHGGIGHQGEGDLAPVYSLGRR